MLVADHMVWYDYILSVLCLVCGHADNPGVANYVPFVQNSNAKDLIIMMRIMNPRQLKNAVLGDIRGPLAAAVDGLALVNNMVVFPTFQ